VNIPDKEFLWFSPETRAPRVSGRALFGVLAGPLAWFVQLCVGVWLANAPCYPGAIRYLAPPHSLAWTWPMLIVLLVVCATVAFAAFLLSWRTWRAAGSQTPSATAPAAARAHFMALVGVVYGAGFCVATLLTVVAFVTLPRCAG
jgi:hypothetical protein